MRTMTMAGLMVATMLSLRAQTEPPAPSGGAMPDASPASLAASKIDRDLKELQAVPHSDQVKTEEGVTALYAETKDFVAKYPDDPHTAPTSLLEVRLGTVMMNQKWPGAPSGAEMDDTLEKLATNPSLPKQSRAQVRLMQIGRDMQTAAQGSDPNAWIAVDSRADQFAQDFGPDFSLDGQRPVLVLIRSEELQALAGVPDPTAFNTLVTKLSASSDPHMVDLARQAKDRQQRNASLMAKPLELKYTAMDGTAVDLAQMRGKVVLVDFWATWSAPYATEVSSVVAAYKKYHDQGFEIVGVSLDQDKDAVLKFTQAHEMTWPQYFDGKGWGNDISSGFGIQSIPAMWLVGKDGMLITTRAREDLAGQVEIALKAK